MRRMPWICIWPGLPQLWFSGLWSGLLLAAGFAVLLNGLLLASFVWVELLSPRDLRLGWGTLGVLWLVSAVVSLRFRRGGPRPVQPAAGEAVFRQSINVYLQGNWYEAERGFRQLVAANGRDAESRLYLATLLRHTRRFDEASEELDRLELLRDSEHWALEIEAERRAIAGGHAEVAQHEQFANIPLPSEEMKQAA
jgi:hypothetical protein